MVSGNQFATLAINNDSEFTGALTTFSIGINRGEKTVSGNFTCAGVFKDESPILEFLKGKDSATLTITITNPIDSSGETTRTITLNRAVCQNYNEIYDSQHQNLKDLNDLLINFVVIGESTSMGEVDWPK
jgi:hypothetical protein